MRVRAPKDFWAGLIFVAIGGGFILLAMQHRYGDMHRMGPAMFPTLVGALLALLGAIVAARGLVLSGEAAPRFHLRPLAVSLLAIVLFGVALRMARTGGGGHRAGAGRGLCGTPGAAARKRRARRGDGVVLGGGVRLAARPAATALAGFVRRNGNAVQSGFRARRRLHLAEHPLLLHRLLSRHAGRRAAGHRTGRHRGDAAAVHLRARSRRRH